MVASADAFIEEMRKKGVECRKPVFKPLHRYFASNGYPASDEAWNTAVSIPLYPSLGNDEVLQIVRSMTEVLSQSL